MTRLLTAAGLAMLVAWPAQGDWFFRGTPNNWDTSPMEQVANTNRLTTCQTFTDQLNPRFKIDRHGDWAESYPPEDFDVTEGSYRIAFDTETRQIAVESVVDCAGDAPAETWYFRGTPNNWGLTAMAQVADTNSYETCQTFEGVANPRFKIDHFGDWLESYPTEDRTVADGSYRITFNAATRAVSTLRVQEGCGGVPPQEDWYFRGTPNGWGTTAMTPIEGTDNYRLVVAFAGEDPSPRFKIDRFGNWEESYPVADVVVDDCSRYEITFQPSTKEIGTHKLADVTEGGCGSGASIVATPPAGRYDSTQTIRLSADHPQGLEVAIYYATDGTEPTTASLRYSGETIMADERGVDVDLDLRVLAVDAEGREERSRFAYRIGQQVTDFREETIYFLLTARFYDGDPANNYFNRDRIKLGDPHWRGDFKGLIEKLDYIKELGFTAIWITPPVENRSGLDYHGYHAYDWTQIDSRLTSEGATYQDLINAAHAKGLKIIQDVVVNHSSQYGIRDKVWIDRLPIKYFRPPNGVIDNGPYQGNLGDYKHPFREDNDNPLAPAWFRARQTSDPEGTVPLVDPLTGETVPKPGYDSKRFFSINPETLDPEWYHLDGFMAGGDWENPQALQNKHLAGDTIDLATERDTVKAYLNNAIFRYLDMGVDAIRVDTVKHMERDNLLEYVNAWKAHKPGLFVFGENLVKGMGLGDLGNDNGPSDIRPWWYTRLGDDRRDPNSGGDSGFSVLDFSLFSTFRDNVSRGHYGGIGGVFDWDWIYGDATQLVTFLQNHDVGPDNDFKYRFQGDTWMAAAAYNLLWTVRGIPCLYYGAEIEFMKAAPQDIDGPDMTIDETGRAYFGHHLEPGVIEDTKRHPLWRHIQRLNQIRRDIPALQKAPMSHLNEFGSGMTFVRDYNDGESYAAVGLAIGGGRDVTISGVRNGEYVDAVTGNRVAVSNGTLSFHVKGNSAGIYVLNGPGKIGTDGVFLR